MKKLLKFVVCKNFNNFSKNKQNAIINFFVKSIYTRNENIIITDQQKKICKLDNATKQKIYDLILVEKERVYKYINKDLTNSNLASNYNSVIKYYYEIIKTFHFLFLYNKNKKFLFVSQKEAVSPP
jgi:hypothetical protein